MERTLNFDIVTDNQGYSYYSIPENTILYRGDTTLYPDFQLPKTPAFFSTDPKFVKHYGILFRFITTAPMKLLILDNHADYTNFYNNAPKDIQTILRRNYGHTSGLRDSAYVSDFKVVNYLCNLGMDGYANDRMNVDPFAVVDAYEGEEDMENRLFHPEMALCSLSKVRFVNPSEDVENYLRIYGKHALQKAVTKKNEDIQKWSEKNKREDSRRGNFRNSNSMGVPFNNSLFDSPQQKKDIFAESDDDNTTDENESETPSETNSSIGINTLPSITSSDNMSDQSLYNSPPSSPSSSLASTPSTPGSPPRRLAPMTLFESPPKKQRRGGKKTMKKKKQHKKKSHRKVHKKKTNRKKHTKKGKKKSKKHTRKRGGVRPPTPDPHATPVMNEIMDNLQRYWINPGLYPRYINEAFAVIGDIDRIEALYREGELRYFFRTLIIDRFRTAIEHDRSNWDLIVNNIRTARTGRLVGQLHERNAMMSQIYQENMVIIGRMNPDSPHRDDHITVRI